MKRDNDELESETGIEHNTMSERYRENENKERIMRKCRKKGKKNRRRCVDGQVEGERRGVEWDGARG